MGRIRKKKKKFKRPNLERMLVGIKTQIATVFRLRELFLSSTRKIKKKKKLEKLDTTVTV